MLASQSGDRYEWHMGRRSLRRRRVVTGMVAVMSAYLLATQSAPQAFVPGGGGGAGLIRPAGVTAVLGLADLQLADPGRRVELLGARVEGPGMDPTVARVDGVRAYELTTSGGIGAVTADDLGGTAWGVPGGWTLVEPAGVVVSEPHLWGLVVVVTGLHDGRWSSQRLVVDYRVNGQRNSQRFDAPVALCVSDVAGIDCAPT